MNKYLQRTLGIAKSTTVKDTFVLFSGNVLSSFFSFLFVTLLARNLSVSDYGVFSAVSNLVVIVISISNLGISSGLVNFVSVELKKKNGEKVNEYIKAAFIIRALAILIISIVIFSFSHLVSSKLLATNDNRVAVWVVVLSFAAFIWNFFPIILQAQRKFLKATMIDVAVSFFRPVLVFLFIFFGGLTLFKAFASYALSAAVIAPLTLFSFLGFSFMFSKPKKELFFELVKFSGWIGVGNVARSISSKLDIQMLAAMTDSATTGYYSVSEQLAFFIILLATSYSSVLATRMAVRDSSKSINKYLLKSLLALLPVVAGILIWAAFAKPFMTLLFGEKYLPAVRIFQMLSLSTIPYLIAIPAVTAITFVHKKPVYIGIFSLIQLASIFVLNLYLIPKYGVYAPAISFGIVYSLMALFSWKVALHTHEKV